MEHLAGDLLFEISVTARTFFKLTQINARFAKVLGPRQTEYLKAVSDFRPVWYHNICNGDVNPCLIDFLTEPVWILYGKSGRVHCFSDESPIIGRKSAELFHLIGPNGVLKTQYNNDYKVAAWMRNGNYYQRPGDLPSVVIKSSSVCHCDITMMWHVGIPKMVVNVLSDGTLKFSDSHSDDNKKIFSRALDALPSGF